MNRSLLCTVEGRGDQWEAICLDLDVAVSASSFDAALADLEKAIMMYVEAAEMEAPADRARLLNRRAPLHLRIRALFHLIASFMRRSGRGDAGGGFLLPCPA